MLKKYLPIIALLAAIVFLYWIKTNQRGGSRQQAEPALSLNRQAAQLIFSKHARCRMECRQINETEVRQILATGKINTARIETDERGTTYPLEGTTADGQQVRIVFAPQKNGKLVVVTVIDLKQEFTCHCN